MNTVMYAGPTPDPWFVPQPNPWPTPSVQPVIPTVESLEKFIESLKPPFVPDKWLLKRALASMQFERAQHKHSGNTERVEELDEAIKDMKEMMRGL